MVGATDVDTGEELVYDFDDLHEDEYVDAIVGSASVPVVFPFTKFRGRPLVDSLSTGWNVNMISAINKCMEIVGDPSKIELDIIVMYNNRLSQEKDANMTTIFQFLRAREIKGYYGLMSDIASFIRANPGIKYRYFV